MRPITTTAVLPALRGGGTIITIGSIGAEYASTSYGASKAALAAWTLACPPRSARGGSPPTRSRPATSSAQTTFRGRLTPERRERLIASMHNGRPGRPEDVAEVACFLASPGARHITGQSLHVNGGAHTTR